ncbi:MAG: hypothetical protein HY516_03370 [Candidatus Aenigmarchaeota archaeon]|nr:hypothetical protein [Candidatus Aenigmarchaeota archaeon]
MVTYMPFLSLARNYLDVESGGAGSQIKLLEHLMGEDPVVYDPNAPVYSPSKTIIEDSKSNILTTTIVARTLDPSSPLFVNFTDKMDAVTPPEFFGRYCNGLRRLNDQHTDNVRRGKSYVLRRIAGLPAYFGQDPINEEDSAKISERLNAKGYKTKCKEFEPWTLMDFVKGNNDVSDKLSVGIIDGLELPTIAFWNGRGRQERVRTHTSKLRLMNAIMAATMEMASNSGIDVFNTPNGDGKPLYEDEYIAGGWAKIGEYMPSPSELLELSRQTVSRAGNYMMFSGIATASERAVYNLRRNDK